VLFLEFPGLLAHFSTPKRNAPPLVVGRFTTFWAGSKIYTVQEIHRRYGVTVQTVLGWIHSGELRAVNVGRRPGAKKPRWRITQEALDAFEQARTPTPPPPRGRRRKRPADVVEFYK
jgi:excisionase family DNA binding protein